MLREDAALMAELGPDPRGLLAQISEDALIRAMAISTRRVADLRVDQIASIIIFYRLPASAGIPRA